tara:strand:- start:23429 stop:24319 length:891 start_codon:yes stop_codon:yes gene_type:complete
MKKQFLDPNIPNKSKKSDENFQFFPNTNIPLPSEIEISESGICNRKCSFCPRSDPDYLDIKDFISNDLFDKLCKELSLYDYQGTIRFSGFVEPLLDKNIYNLINRARKIIPLVNIEMVTNGDVLNLKRLLKLFEKGLNKLLISVYDSKEDAENFDILCKKANLTKEQYIIRHRYLPPEEDFGITLSNRAGMMKNAEYTIENPIEPLNNPCYIPSYTFFLDYQGDVLMCPHDWGKKMILGNLKNETLKDIWLSKQATFARKQLIGGNRNFEPCKSCDVTGTLIGKKHSKSWKIYYNK